MGAYVLRIEKFWAPLTVGCALIFSAVASAVIAHPLGPQYRQRPGSPVSNPFQPDWWTGRYRRVHAPEESAVDIHAPATLVIVGSKNRQMHWRASALSVQASDEAYANGRVFGCERTGVGFLQGAKIHYQARQRGMTPELQFGLWIVPEHSVQRTPGQATVSKSRLVVRQTGYCGGTDTTLAGVYERLSP
jgi:hypothetical protein